MAQHGTLRDLGAGGQLVRSNDERRGRLVVAVRRGGEDARCTLALEPPGAVAADLVAKHRIRVDDEPLAEPGAGRKVEMPPREAAHLRQVFGILLESEQGDATKVPHAHHRFDMTRNRLAALESHAEGDDPRGAIEPLDAPASGREVAQAHLPRHGRHGQVRQREVHDFDLEAQGIVPLTQDQFRRGDDHRLRDTVALGSAERLVHGPAVDPNERPEALALDTHHGLIQRVEL